MSHANPQPLILASGSATRQAMLRQAGLAFTAISPGVDEAAFKTSFTGPPAALALALAQAKAAAVAALHPNALVIGADQILLCEDRIFSKPETLDEAAAHLRALRGRTHSLLTASCIFQNNSCLWADSAEARLTMRDFTDEFLSNYLAAEGSAAFETVGAYKLEARGAQLFSAISGDIFVILGLNLLGLLKHLRARGHLPL